MTLTKPPTQRPAEGFGRRGTPKPRQASAPSAPQRRPTVSAGADARTRETLVGARDAVAADVGTAASRGKAYVRACLAGAAAFLAALFVLTGVENRIFQAGPMLVVLAVPVLPTLALVLYIPTVVLSDIARLLSIPRGWADIGIGVTLGAGLGTAVAMTGPPDEGRSLMTTLAMTAGGFVGGFAFWRAQGYPGTSAAGAATLDRVYEEMT